MYDILIKIFPHLRNYMSKRASNFLSFFGGFSLFFLLFSLLPSPIPKESSEIFLIIFLLVTAMIPILFIILWIIDLKHLWDMRIVAVIETDPRGFSYPQNAINAKKLKLKFRKMTKEEKHKWGLDKKEKISVVLKKLLYTTSKEIKLKRMRERLNDPNLPIEEYREIREELE